MGAFSTIPPTAAVKLKREQRDVSGTELLSSPPSHHLEVATVGSYAELEAGDPQALDEPSRKRLKMSTVSMDSGSTTGEEEVRYRYFLIFITLIKLYKYVYIIFYSF